MTHSPIVVGLGEILWDVFPDGPRFGGAPANFACHSASLGGQASMVSAVGTNELGDMAIAALRRHYVDTACVARLKKFPTGTVQVELDCHGQPRYEFGQNEAWDHLNWSTEISVLARRTDAVCFGTLGQRSPTSRQTIKRFVGAIPDHALRVFDVNLRPPYYDDEVIHQSLEIANVIKLNDDELYALSSTYGLTGTATDRMRQLAQRFELPLIALSRGENGAVLVQGDKVSEFPGVEVNVKDTVGAGDAFTAATILGLLKGQKLEMINRHACRVAAFVCSQAGATPALPSELAGIWME